VIDVLVIGGIFIAVLYAPRLGWTQAPDYSIHGNGFYVGPGEPGSGKLITESRDVHDFKSIRLSYPAQVVINQGEVESLTIQADDNVAGDIGTQEVNGVLDIKNINGFQIPISPTQPVKITVVVKDLDELDFETA